MLSTQTLQLCFTSQGFDVKMMKWFAVIVLPYSLKFLWAPLFDRYSLAGGERRRVWIMFFQALMIVLILLMGCLSQLHGVLSFGLQSVFSLKLYHYQIILVLGFCLAVASASQDIVIDAYRADYLVEEERKAGATFTQLSYRVAVLIGCSVVSVIGGELGWMTAYCFAAVLMLGCFLYTTFVLPNMYSKFIPKNMKQALIPPLMLVLKRKKSWVIISFLLTYKFAYYMAMAPISFFLNKHLGFTVSAIAAVSKPATLTGVFLGSVVVSVIMPKLPLYRSLFIFGLLELLSNLVYVVLYFVGKSITMMAVSFFVVNFIGSMGTVFFTAFMLGLCNTGYTITQYAFFSALMTLSSVITALFSAWYIPKFGYLDYYILSCVAGVPCLVLLSGMKKTWSCYVVSANG